MLRSGSSLAGCFGGVGAGPVNATAGFPHAGQSVDAYHFSSRQLSILATCRCVLQGRIVGNALLLGPHKLGVVMCPWFTQMDPLQHFLHRRVLACFLSNLLPDSGVGVKIGRCLT